MSDVKTLILKFRDENVVAQTAQQTFPEFELDNGNGKHHKDRNGGMQW